MKTNPKKCKGLGKAKGSGCNQIHPFRRLGLCPECYPNWLLNTPNGQEKLNKARITGKNKVKRIKAKERTAKKEADKSIARCINDARLVFQRWIRYRDANESCISCHSVDSAIWDAGHFYKAELYTGMIFDERNVHKQCRKCNTYLNGNENPYRQKLEQKFGQTWLQQLDRDAQVRRMYSWTRAELNAIKEKYAKLLKEIR